MSTLLTWTRFLQSTSKGLNIKENETLQQHGAATVTCLLSGFNVFCHTYAEQDRALRVAKGLHGLHVYATEFWTEYLLSWAASESPRAEHDPVPLLDIACKLAASLSVSPATTTPTLRHLNKRMDGRLKFLEQYPLLLKLVHEALQARSLESLESRILRNCLIDQEPQQHSDPLIVPDGISKMLVSYQEVVKSLLDQKHHPELSADEFELFKVHFGATAYTCQLTSCPRATIGFETEELLKEHEKCHVRWFQCTVSGCQFPSFVSARALKSHARKHHTVTVNAKVIRRPGTGIGTPVLADERPIKLRNTGHPQNDVQSSRLTNEESYGSLFDGIEDQTQHDSQYLTILPPFRTISSDEENTALFNLSDYAYGNGTLKDGREYKVTSFTLKGCGETLFMFLSDCLHCFHPPNPSLLYKRLNIGTSRASMLQKQDLFARNIIDPWRVDSDVKVVMASTVFMVYGPQSINGYTTDWPWHVPDGAPDR